MQHFPTHSLLDYALAVEKVTTAKKDTVSVAPSLWYLLAELGRVADIAFGFFIAHPQR